jgi:hypothetical protein
MCVSSAAGEPLPVHGMFYYDAHDKTCLIDYRWIADFPCVQGIFGCEDLHKCCTQLTMNDKGGSDCRVLNRCPTGFQERLYTDAADVPGKRLFYKIDRGPGSDEDSLAEKEERGIYLFSGVQNTAQVHHEMDQNYGQLSYDFCWIIATLTADLVRKFSRHR